MRGWLLTSSLLDPLTPGARRVGIRVTHRRYHSTEPVPAPPSQKVLLHISLSPAPYIHTHTHMYIQTRWAPTALSSNAVK